MNVQYAEKRIRRYSAGIEIMTDLVLIAIIAAGHAKNNAHN